MQSLKSQKRVVSGSYCLRYIYAQTTANKDENFYQNSTIVHGEWCWMEFVEMHCESCYFTLFSFFENNLFSNLFKNVHFSFTLPVGVDQPQYSPPFLDRILIKWII